MKYYLFLLIALLLSCEQKKKVVSEPITEKEKTKISDSSELKDSEDSHPWFQFYQKENPDFKNKSFELGETNLINYQKTSVVIMNEKGFNEIYKPFFIFNPSKTKYLDFDSYQWFLLKDGSAGFEADQQVVLVDLKKKEAKQIAFFGPSFWIEDAYWKGDSVAVLLGNTYEKVPFKMKYNFKNNTVTNYKYTDTLKFETSYSKFRLKSKGIKVD